MSTILVSGVPVDAPGLAASWHRRYQLVDVEQRAPGTWVRSIVLTGTRDARPKVLPGVGPSSAQWLDSGGHFLVGLDGRVHQAADPLAEAVPCCPGLDPVSVGVVLEQGQGGEMREGQLGAAVALLDLLTRQLVTDAEGRTLSVLRQIPHDYVGPLRRFGDAEGVGGYSGIIGRRDASRASGRGDPGDAVFYRLGAAGYDVRNLGLSEDRDAARRVQRAAGIAPADGLLGPESRRALEAQGYPHGQLVWRPGDDPRPAHLQELVEEDGESGDDGAEGGAAG